jgi:two-component system OmpR family response regulator
MRPVHHGRRVAVIIEDDDDIRHLLDAVLSQAGFETVLAATGLDGIQAVQEHTPLITTLDVSLPGIDGFETARRIRAFSTTYIVMLTARSDEIDTLLGLESGADDYIAKPFRPRELRARIDAVLRRSLYPAGIEPGQSAPLLGPGAYAQHADPADDLRSASPDWIEHNGLRLSATTRLVTLNGDPLNLTRTEFDLLSTLLESQQRVRTKAELAVLLRGESYVTSYSVSSADTRAVEAHLGNLRRKLGDDVAAPLWLETVRGVGYRLAPSRP